MELFPIVVVDKSPPPFPINVKLPCKKEQKPSAVPSACMRWPLQLQDCFKISVCLSCRLPHHHHTKLGETNCPFVCTEGVCTLITTLLDLFDTANRFIKPYISHVTIILSWSLSRWVIRNKIFRAKRSCQTANHLYSEEVCFIFVLMKSPS